MAGTVRRPSTKKDGPEQAPKDPAKWERGVSQRPNGRFTYRWRDPETRKQRSADFRSYAEAASLSRQTRDQLAAGTYRDATGARVVLRDYCAEYAARKVRSGDWKDQSGRIFQRMARTLELFGLADRTLGKVTESDVAAWVHWMNTEANLGRSLSPNTAALYLGLLRQVFGYALKKGHVTVDVTRGLDVKAPKGSGRRAGVREEEVPSDGQLHAIRAELPSWMRVIVTLGATCGLRSGEARGLRVRDFHALKRRVEVVQQLLDVPGKGQVPGPLKTEQSARFVPLTDETVAEIAAHLATHRPGASGDDLVVTQPNGEPLDDGRLTYRWTQACAAAGVRGHVFHQTRHKFATDLISDGIDVVTVAKLMGHENADQVIRRYGHVASDYMDRTRAVMAARSAARRVQG